MWTFSLQFLAENGSETDATDEEEEMDASVRKVPHLMLGILLPIVMVIAAEACSTMRWLSVFDLTATFTCTLSAQESQEPEEDGHATTEKQKTAQVDGRCFQKGDSWWETKESTCKT